MAKSRNQEKRRKRLSLLVFVNEGLKIGKKVDLNGKAVVRAFMVHENFCVEFNDGSWTRVESKKDRNYIYHQCLQ